jgi:hypothetical protein
MNINTKISAGLIAQNEDSAEQQDRNLKVVSLSRCGAGQGGPLP